MLLNVLDFESEQAALDAARNGDRVYFPGVRPYTAPAGGWQIRSGIELFGDGPGAIGADNGTVLRTADTTSPLLRLVPPIESVHIHDMQLRREGTATDGGAGILCLGGIPTAPKQASHLSFRRLLITGFAGDGIRLWGYGNASTCVNHVSIIDCMIRNCGGIGLRLTHALDVYVAACEFAENRRNGLAAVECGIALYQCGFDANCWYPSWTPQQNPTEGNLKLQDCTIASVDSCRFVNFEAGNVKKACVFIGSSNGIVGACQFLTGDLEAECQGIYVTGQDSGPVAVLSNRFGKVKTLVKVDSGVYDCVITPQYDETGTGSIVVPSVCNDGLFGATHINRDSGNLVTGLILPASPTDPTENARDGMLVYNPELQTLRAHVDGQWVSIVLRS